MIDNMDCVYLINERSRRLRVMYDVYKMMLGRIEYSIFGKLLCGNKYRLIQTEMDKITNVLNNVDPYNNIPLCLFKQHYQPLVEKYKEFK